MKITLKQLWQWLCSIGPWCYFVWSWLLLGWKYRKPGILTLADVTKFPALYQDIVSAEDAIAAQKAVKAALELPSINAIIATTETKWDDEQLERLKKLVDNDVIFRTGWKILHGDWSFRVSPDRQKGFIERIRAILPFASPDTNNMELSSEKLQDAQAEAAVIEIVGFIWMLVQALPPLIKSLKKK